MMRRNSLKSWVSLGYQKGVLNEYHHYSIEHDGNLATVYIPTYLS